MYISENKLGVTIRICRNNLPDVIDLYTGNLETLEKYLELNHPAWTYVTIDTTLQLKKDNSSEVCLSLQSN